VYVLSGEISNITTEIVEVLNLDDNSVGTLSGPGFNIFLSHERSGQLLITLHN
jgi:hypothetical protein